MTLLVRKLKFISDQLNYLSPHKEKSIEELSKDYKELKFVEKIIQELVDCASDINESIVKHITRDKPFSSKRSFRSLNQILEKYKLQWDEEKVRLFIDSGSTFILTRRRRERRGL